ncbi:hypothetical protein CMK13_03575, partial [Candidatus Poribacteria bacterium]
EVQNYDDQVKLGDLEIKITNKKRKKTGTSIIENNGTFTYVYIGIDNSLFAEARDILEITVKSDSDESFTNVGTIVGRLFYTVTESDVTHARTKIIKLSIHPRPEINEIKPATGAIEGGTPIKITGANFRDGASLIIGENVAVATTINSENEITALTPVGVVGPMDLTVTNSDGRSDTLSQAFTYIQLPPTILTVTPLAADIAGGEIITITGENFDSQATIQFGEEAGIEPVIEKEKVTVTVPKSNIVGDVTLIVINPDGQRVETNFSYVEVFPWDVNGNGTVDIFDLVTVASEFGQTEAGLSGDVNRDGSVDIFDLVAVASHFGETASTISAPTILSDQIDQLKLALVQLESSKHSLAAQLLRQWMTANGHLPKESQLLANFPNPFNPETWIPYQLTNSASVSLIIYDVNGQVVRKIEVGHRLMGLYTTTDQAVYWDGRDDLGEIVTSGVYFYTLIADDFHQTKKMILLK